MRRVLVISCSRRKRKGRGVLPAIERYDGPIFRLLRRFLAQARKPPKILILSARYGLIELDHPTANYDEKMTAQTAYLIRGEVGDALRVALKGAGGRIVKTDLFLCMGRNYIEAIGAQLPPSVSVRLAPGSMGTKLAALHQWLYALPPTTVIWISLADEVS